MKGIIREEGVGQVWAVSVRVSIDGCIGTDSLTNRNMFKVKIVWGLGLFTVSYLKQIQSNLQKNVLNTLSVIGLN